MARTFVNVRFDDSLTFDSNEFIIDARITQRIIPSYSHCALKMKKGFTKQREGPWWCIRRWSISNCCQDLCIYVYPRRACCNRGCANLNSVESGVRIKMPKILVHARPIGASRATDSRIESSEPRNDNSRGSISLLAQTAKLGTHANLEQSTHTRVVSALQSWQPRDFRFLGQLHPVICRRPWIVNNSLSRRKILCTEKLNATQTIGRRNTVKQAKTRRISFNNSMYLRCRTPGTR